jgi:hypothetical protein
MLAAFRPMLRGALRPSIQKRFQSPPHVSRPRAQQKVLVVAMVERTLVNRRGRVRSLPMERVTAENIKPVLKQYIERVRHFTRRKARCITSVGMRFRIMIRIRGKSILLFRMAKWLQRTRLPGEARTTKRGCDSQ